MVKSLNGGAGDHTVLIELYDQKRLSRGMASVKSMALHIFLKHFYFFKSIIKAF